MKKLFIFLFFACFSSFSQTCTLTGLSCLSYNQTSTYTTVATSGASYFWSVTGGLTIVGSNTGSSVSVQSIANSSGQICVTKYKAG